jgi:hypothetical protein
VSRSRYTRDRNSWRKVYGFRRQKAEVFSYEDNGKTKKRDLTGLIRHRDFFRLGEMDEAMLIIPEIILAEYDEGIITFTAEESTNQAFNFVFSGVPQAVVLTHETYGTNEPRINYFGLNFTTSEMNVAASAPWTGTLRYRAVYSNTGLYPRVVTSSFAPLSGTFNVMAGTALTLPKDDVTVNVGHSHPSLGPIQGIIQTPWDFNNTFDQDYTLEEISRANNETISCATAPPGVAVIRFIAFF